METQPEKISIGPRQRDILRHALGWPKCYRNHFCVGEGSDDFEDCEALAAAGLMIRIAPDHGSLERNDHENRYKNGCPDVIYMVTERGRALLDEGLLRA
jgi:hypothetical protein